jgi:hypothetical protein
MRRESGPAGAGGMRSTLRGLFPLKVEPVRPGHAPAVP